MTGQEDEAPGVDGDVEEKEEEESNDPGGGRREKKQVGSVISRHPKLVADDNLSHPQNGRNPENTVPQSQSPNRVRDSRHPK